MARWCRGSVADDSPAAGKRSSEDARAAPGGSRASGLEERGALGGGALAAGEVELRRGWRRRGAAVAVVEIWGGCRGDGGAGERGCRRWWGCGGGRATAAGKEAPGGGGGNTAAVREEACVGDGARVEVGDGARRKRRLELGEVRDECKQESSGGLLKASVSPLFMERTFSITASSGCGVSP